MRILGVDPGSQRTGWGVVTGTAHRPTMLACDDIRLTPGRSLAERLHQLREEFEAVVRRLEPESAAVEAAFHGVNARSALQLAHARGVVLAVLGGLAIPVTEYTPAKIKSSVTGNGRAEKGQVEAMVMRLLSLESAPGNSDRADALAVAYCHLVHARSAAAIARTTRPTRESTRS